MTIHREGYRIIVLFLLALIVVNIVFIPFHHFRGWLFYLISGGSAFFFLFVILFFRKPKRSVKFNSNHILAPADGSIVAIEEVLEELYFHDSRLQVSIFMSPLNIHMNFCSISGTVEYMNHEPGNYWVAWHPKSSKENERTSIVIKHSNGIPILIRQIAGAVARRIVTYLKPGNEVQQGDELGFIKFGSRVDIFLPLNVKLNVGLDQKVKGNKTVIASFE